MIERGRTKLRPARGRSVSSRAWLQRQINDPYVRRAKREGMRSRAAYKLAEIDGKHHILKPGGRVIDLGELIGRARTKSFALGAAHVGIVDLALEPRARRHAPPARRA